MEGWYDGARNRIPNPILFHDKFEKDKMELADYRSIVDMLDVSMMARQRDGLGNAQAFLGEFEPTLNEANFDREVLSATLHY